MVVGASEVAKKDLWKHLLSQNSIIFWALNYLKPCVQWAGVTVDIVWSKLWEIGKLTASESGRWIAEENFF